MTALSPPLARARASTRVDDHGACGDGPGHARNGARAKGAVLAAADVAADAVADADADADANARALAGLPRRAAAAWLQLLPEPSAEHLTRSRELLAGSCSLAGTTFAFTPQSDWRHNPGVDAECIIALHKLPMLVDLAQAWRAERNPAVLHLWSGLAAAWLARMGTGELACSDAQVEAKRVEHLLQALLIVEASGGLALLPSGLVPALLERIDDEAGYLQVHLKPSRNHRTFQLHAVVLAGLLVSPCLEPDRRTASIARARQAVDLLCANLLTDFGADGVHCELSTHYHQITLETALAFVTVCQACDVHLPEALHRRLQLALAYAAWMALPDGEMPLINDADTGDLRPVLAQGAFLYGDAPLAFVASAGRKGQPPAATSKHFTASGYVILRDGWGRDPVTAARAQHVFYDCAGLGAGSHAHYDLFSFCYSIAGRQVVVDPGRYTYNAEPDAQGIDWRHRFKRTAAHNTVCIDGLDQTRYLSKARQPAAGLHKLDRSQLAPGASKHGPAVQRIAPHVRLGRRSDLVLASARSSEYEPVHGRCLVYVQRQYLLVLDQVDCLDAQAHSVSLHLQLAQTWLHQVQTDPRTHGLALRAPGWQILVEAPGAEVELGCAWVSRHYGHKQPAPHLAATRRAADRVRFVTLLAPHDEALRINALHARLDEEHLEVVVHGEGAGQAFVDRFVLDGQSFRATPDPAEAMPHYVLERHVGAHLDHHFSCGADAWLNRVGCSADHGRVAMNPSGAREC